MEEESFTKPYPANVMKHLIYLNYNSGTRTKLAVSAMIDDRGVEVITGYILIEKAKRKDQTIISSLTVGSNYRRMGIANELISFAIEYSLYQFQVSCVFVLLFISNVLKFSLY